MEPASPPFDAAQAAPAARLLDLARQSTARISKIELDGKTYWVKRREKLGLRMRLQKGDAAAAFERERAAYRQLSRAGLPVPPLVAEDSDLFVIPDCGSNLARILRRQSGTLQERVAIFDKAARALAEFHRAGFSHGRPSLKDILWDGERIRLIDFERFAPDRKTTAHFAEDVLIIVFNALSVSVQHCAEIDQIAESYRGAGDAEVWRLAKMRARRMRWMNWLTKPIQWRGPGKASEFKALPLTLDYFRRR
ncbi:MAG: phosphotransferase [Alphaproteobacteria bacterium]|nr:phosphotransferase [Alphaproteobacteria bacterium]